MCIRDRDRQHDRADGRREAHERALSKPGGPERAPRAAGRGPRDLSVGQLRSSTRVRDRIPTGAYATRQDCLDPQWRRRPCRVSGGRPAGHSRTAWRFQPESLSHSLWYVGRRRQRRDPGLPCRQLQRCGRRAGRCLAQHARRSDLPGRSRGDGCSRCPLVERLAVRLGNQAQSACAARQSTLTAIARAAAGFSQYRALDCQGFTVCGQHHGIWLCDRSQRQLLSGPSRGGDVAADATYGLSNTPFG